MIGDLIIGSIVAIMGYFLSILPIASPITGLDNAITQAGRVLAYVDPVFPVLTLLAVLGAFLGVELAIFLYTIVRWFYRKIPGIT